LTKKRASRKDAEIAKGCPGIIVSMAGSSRECPGDERHAPTVFANASAFFAAWREILRVR
jgi:hypothetical protein